MISKIFLTGKTFRETSVYLCEDLTRSEVLAVEGVRGHDHRLMALDFELQHQFLPEKEKAVFHGMLSFPPGERPDNGLMVEIAQRYLLEIGMTNTQYAIVKHIDKDHLHMHILANKVDNDGRIIGKGLIIERGIKAAQKLTREYKLTQEMGKDLQHTHLKALHAPDEKRYRLYQTIKEELPGCRQIEDLEKRLMLRGITTHYRRNPNTGVRQGISFRMENMAFGGKEVDPAFSITRLERTILEQTKAEELGQRLTEDLIRQLRQGAGVGKESGQGLGKGQELSKENELREDEELIHRRQISHGHDYGLGF